MSAKSGFAVENIKRICEKYLPGRYTLEIIDIARDKHLALEYQIVAIPTLMKVHPAPRRMILGDLSDTQKVLHLLDLL